MEIRMTTTERRATPAVTLDGAKSALEPPGSTVARQIAALRHLPDGWRNGDGIAFDVAYLDWLADACVRLYPPNAPTPTVCPTTYGIVALEWSLPGASISLEIDPETGQGDLVWANARLQKSGEIAIGEMAKPAAWHQLAKCLNQFTGVSE